jgi:hypothetical protein
MTESNSELKAIHAEACAAVIKADRQLSPEDDRFWPLYLRAALFAARATISDIRRRALEDAAKVCSARADTFAERGSRSLQRAALNCADAIRTLQEPQA